MSPLRNMLVTISGANRDVLAKAPGEEIKQAALGGAILTTAVLATVSAAMAIHMAFDAWWFFALPLGAIWGLGILNLDRWLVVATARGRMPLTTILMALPRVLLAIVIGAVVSTPLTLQIFEDEIAEHLTVQHREDQAAFETALQSDPRFITLDAKKQEIEALRQTVNTKSTDTIVFNDPTVTDLRNQLTAAQAEFEQADKEVQCEKEGTCGSGRAGVGPAAHDKEVRRDRLAAAVTDLEQRLATQTTSVQSTAKEELAAQQGDAQADLTALQSEVAGLEDARADLIADHDSAVAADDGLLARFGAMEDLQDEDPNLRTIHLGLFLFLTIIECVPVLFKTMLSLGRPSLYEWYSLKEAEHIQDRLFLRHQTEYEEAELLAQSRLEAAQARAATELDAELRAAGAVLDAQIGLAEEAVAKWKSDQSEKLAKDISQWLTSDEASYDAVFESFPNTAGDHGPSRRT